MSPKYDSVESSKEEALSTEICRNATLKASISLAILIPFYFLFSTQLVNTCFPVILGGICLSVIFALRRIALSQLILLPITWFLLACVVYYGIGPLFYVFGNIVSIAEVDAYYCVSENALWRTNLLNIISIALILYFFSLGMGSIRFRPFKRLSNNATLKRTAHFLIFLGITFTLVTYQMRSILGQDFLMPGIFYTFARCSLSGLFLYSLFFFSGQKEMRLPLLLMTGFVGYFALTSLMKQNILEFAFVLFLGSFIAHPSIKKLIIAASVVLVMLPTMSTLTTYARIMTWTGDSTQTSAIRLMDVASDTETFLLYKDANADDQGLFRRILYAPAQNFAMDAYDSGNRGRSLDVALWALVPRLIYPNKPVITQGHEFTYLVKGAAIGGGSGAGFFGEAYWNFGWVGVILMSIIIGFLLATYSQFNINMVSTGNYQFFPVAFMALALGYRIDDWFVATSINSIPLMIALYFMINFISRKSS